MNYIKVLAIDYGEKRIGLAVGDSESRIASPLKTIKNRGYEKSCYEILKIVTEWDINLVIIGIPEIYSDQEINKKIENFGKIIEKNLEIEVIFYNEDYSSN